MTEERFEKLLREAAREYNEPPPAPREEIWARIAASRKPRTASRACRSRLGDAVDPGRWRWWPAAAAGTLALALGIVIGRLGAPGGPGADRARVPGMAEPFADGAGDSEAGARRAQLYAWTAAPYLSRVETLLTLVQSRDDPGASAARVSDWARDLLLETRLLMDSPAQHDEELWRLLQDLELVLVQIIRQPDEAPAGSGRWVRDSVRQRSILGRLRQRTPAGESSVAAWGVQT